MIKNLIFSTVILFAFVSCNKSEDKPSKQFQSTAQNETSSECRYFTDAQIDRIGSYHNQYVENAFINFNWKAHEYAMELRQQMLALPLENLSKQDKQEVYRSIYSEQEIRAELGNEANQFMSVILRVIENPANVNELKNKLDNIMMDAHSKLACRDLEAILVMCAVSKKSAEFWFPERYGGTGLMAINDDGNGNKFIPSLSKAAALRVVRADGMAAAGAFMAIGHLLVATPVTIGGLAVAVGFPAAWASFGQLLAEL